MNPCEKKLLYRKFRDTFKKTKYSKHIVLYVITFANDESHVIIQAFNKM